MTLDALERKRDGVRKNGAVMIEMFERMGTGRYFGLKYLTVKDNELING
jgi:hypothetical protein